MYKSIWIPVVGECLGVAREEANHHDHYAVPVMKDSTIVGHVPREYSRTFNFFIIHGGGVSCELTGSRKLGVGLEVPCIYKLTGKERLVLKAKDIIAKKKLE